MVLSGTVFFLRNTEYCFHVYLADTPKRNTNDVMISFLTFRWESKIARIMQRAVTLLELKETQPLVLPEANRLQPTRKNAANASVFVVALSIFTQKGLFW